MPRLLFRIFLFSLFYGYATLALATEIKQVDIHLQDRYYEVSADIDYQLSSVAKEALENGVPLFWDLHIKVRQQRSFWWAKTLLNLNIRYRLQYHVLLNLYRVVIVQPTNPLVDSEPARTTSYNFSTLSAALDLMASLRRLPLVETNRLAANRQYWLELKADFDRGALPLPLQSIAYINPQWYLSSDWTLWPLKK